MLAKQLVFWLCLIPACALAEKPAISPGGVVNAATFAAADGPWRALAAGSIATVFGQNLATETATADRTPLPVEMKGTSVTVNGVLAPLFYVSPSQVNFQIPSSTAWSYDSYRPTTIVVTTDAGASDPVSVDIAMRSPGIFALNSSGCGAGAILNIGSDGTMSVNSPANSAAPGQYVALFGTGLGPVYNAPGDGAEAPVWPLAISQSGMSAIVGGQSVSASFAGRAPEQVGVDQINILLPEDVAEGCAVPVRAWANQVTLSIRRGGGACVDPPVESSGKLLLRRSVV